MSDVIRKAVELADNFSADGRNNYRIQEPDQFPIFATRKNPPQWFLGALAAQLARQAIKLRPVEFVYHDDPLETIKEIIDGEYLK